MKDIPRIVIDTHVLVSALRSRLGWSFDLLSQLGRGTYQHVVTVPLVMEVEDVLLRPSMVLEAAVNGQCQAIVTWNIRDFAAASEFGIAVFNPQAFLTTLKGETP